MCQAQSIEVIHYILTNCRNTDTNINLHYTHHQHLLFVLVTILFLQTHNICVDCVECGGGRGKGRCRSIVRVFTIITFNCRRLRHSQEVSHTCGCVTAASSPPCKVGHHTRTLWCFIRTLGGGRKRSHSCKNKDNRGKCEIMRRSKPFGE